MPMLKMAYCSIFLIMTPNIIEYKDLKNLGHKKVLLQKINQQYVISRHTKFEYNATSGF